MNRNESSLSITKFHSNKRSIFITFARLARIVTTVSVVASSLVFLTIPPSLAKPLPSCVITQELSGGGLYRRIRVFNRCAYSVRIGIPQNPPRLPPQCIILAPRQAIVLTVPVGSRLEHC